MFSREGNTGLHSSLLSYCLESGAAYTTHVGHVGARGVYSDPHCFNFSAQGSTYLKEYSLHSTVLVHERMNALSDNEDGMFEKDLKKVSRND